MSLFSESGERSRNAMKTIDNIRKKFGNAAIGRASQARPMNRKKPRKTTAKE